MSPNDVKIVFGRRATSMARSIISSGVTQTGQPGPWTRVTISGSIWSIPDRSSVCVWPPQISMTAHGRVTVLRIARIIACAPASSRYSSTYFIAATVAGSGALPALRDVEALQLAHLLQRLEDVEGVLLVELADGEA